ncbi:hypothetical protein AXG93_4142s1230 [Marchantia polymorpha subsp. ruderalis]|uniref:Uncharacterized protein n=1 Tax=Marchantia polymorpha subsp. ruderalis TaxID=1480154 RepID=A0A176WLK2_MARPO|nr:hypothetical protein AXG93_4142s1230 [Marchantia polymorpha subsp. ruderalis]
MARSTQLRMVPLKVPQIERRAFQNEMSAVKLDFLLKRGKIGCSRRWSGSGCWRRTNLRAVFDHIRDWEEVLGRCAGEEGDLLFNCESVQVTKEEEISFGALFKKSKSSKNGYKTRDYKDRMRRNVAVALLQILNSHLTTYCSSARVCRSRRKKKFPLVRFSRKAKWSQDAQGVSDSQSDNCWSADCESDNRESAGFADCETDGANDQCADAFGGRTFSKDTFRADCAGRTGSRSGRCKGSGAAVAAEAAARHSSRESPRDSVATEILETEDETSSEEQEADSVQKTPSPTARRMGPTTSVRTPSADAPSARTPSAQIAPEGQAAEAGGARVTKVTAASTPSQTDETSSEEQEEDSVQKTPTGAKESTAEGVHRRRHCP